MEAYPDQVQAREVEADQVPFPDQGQGQGLGRAQEVVVEMGVEADQAQAQAQAQGLARDQAVEVEVALVQVQAQAMVVAAAAAQAKVPVCQVKAPASHLEQQVHYLRPFILPMGRPSIQVEAGRNQRGWRIGEDDLETGKKESREENFNKLDEWSGRFVFRLKNINLLLSLLSAAFGWLYSFQGVRPMAERGERKRRKLNGTYIIMLWYFGALLDNYLITILDD